MTWKVVTEKTNKILCQSSIRTALDPSERNLSLDLLKTTDFKLDKSPNDNVPSDIPDDSHQQVVYFRDHGEEKLASKVVGNKFKSVITDANGEPKKDSDGNIMYRLGPHPDDLPGRNLRIPHPDSGLPSHITIGKMIDDYEKGLEENKVRQPHFEVKFSRDKKEDIMSYNEIVDFMNRDDALYDCEYWNFRKIIGHEKTPQKHPQYKGSQ